MIFTDLMPIETRVICFNAGLEGTSPMIPAEYAFRPGVEVSLQATLLRGRDWKGSERLWDLCDYLGRRINETTGS